AADRVPQDAPEQFAPVNVHVTVRLPLSLAVALKDCPASMVAELAERLVMPPPGYPPEPHPARPVITRAIATPAIGATPFLIRENHPIDSILNSFRAKYRLFRPPIQLTNITNGITALCLRQFFDW